MITILVAADAKWVRDQVRAAFMGRGQNVVEVTRGQDVRDMFAEVDPDLHLFSPREQRREPACGRRNHKDFGSRLRQHVRNRLPVPQPSTGLDAFGQTREPSAPGGYALASGRTPCPTPPRSRCSNLIQKRRFLVSYAARERATSIHAAPQRMYEIRFVCVFLI